MKKPEIIYEDETLCVCYKPAGLATQTKNVRQIDLERMLLAYLPDVYVTHRLDQPVQGIIAFAKSKSAAAFLSRQFQSDMAHKHYLAVVEGFFEREDGVLTDYLKKDGRANVSVVVPQDTDGAKSAKLSYAVLESKDNSQLLKINLMTGRHHQIRVQLSHAGHPIRGDRKYNSFCQRETGNAPLALCAYSLELLHPVTKKKLRFEISPRGGFFQDFKILREGHID